MSDVMAEIIRWAKSLKYWEQATLGRILRGERFTDEAYQEIYGYFLEDVGLQKKSDDPRPELKSLDETNIPAEAPRRTVRLTQISNLQNVNALAKDQVIPFSPQLTAIYGANASGKSGYARVFGCAGFTRGDKQVLPNITDEAGAGVRQSADIEICSEDGDEGLCYLIGEANPVFSFCHVFDSTSVNVHLNRRNEFSFSPAGLESLARLAAETDVVRKMLRDRIAELQKPHDFSKFFVGEKTAVSDLIRDLRENTDTEVINRLANVTEEDTKRAGEQGERLNFLKSLNVDAKVKAYNKDISDLNELKKKLRVVGEQLNDDFFIALNSSIAAYSVVSQLAKQMGVDQFKCDYFTRVGSDRWYDFIKAAKELAIAEGVPPERDPYPQDSERCLLCRQELSGEALDLIRRIWKFLEDDVQKRLKDAENVLKGIKGGLGAIQMDFFSEDSVYFRLVHEKKEELIAVIQIFLNACEARKNKVLELIDGLKEEIPAPLPDNGFNTIDEIISAITKERDDLLKNDPVEEIGRLENSLMLYRHRLILQGIKKDVIVYVALLAWASAASRSIGNTAHITKKHDGLFEKVVTQRYIEYFNGVLNELDQKINIKIDTIPRKGATYKQIVLEKCVANAPDATPDKILSEGEKRAVSLADFLTEVDSDPGCSSVVLDDPVTSFDLEWRKKIAPILAKGAAKRQIIIFTHDLAFLYYLIEAAEKEGVEVLCHWIQRGWVDGLPGYVSIDNSPAIDRSFRKPTKAQQIFERAKDEADFSERERLLKDGFSSLRTCYEAFIVYELFNEVVERFSERISFGRLADIVWDESTVQEAMEKYEDLSQLMEGHLHSTRFAYRELTPDILYAEIQFFAGLRGKLKGLKKKRTA